MMHYSASFTSLASPNRFFDAFLTTLFFALLHQQGSTSKRHPPPHTPNVHFVHPKNSSLAYRLAFVIESSFCWSVSGERNQRILHTLSLQHIHHPSVLPDEFLVILQRETKLKNDFCKPHCKSFADGLDSTHMVVLRKTPFRSTPIYAIVSRNTMYVSTSVSICMRWVYQSILLPITVDDG